MTVVYFISKTYRRNITILLKIGDSPCVKEISQYGRLST